MFLLYLSLMMLGQSCEMHYLPHISCDNALYCYSTISVDKYHFGSPLWMSPLTASLLNVVNPHGYSH